MAFRDASLETFEAKKVGPWPRSVAAGTVQPVHPDAEGFVVSDLSFIEPDLAFSVAGRHDDVVKIRVHLSHEAAPPWTAAEERLDTWQFFVNLTVPGASLDGIATSWEREVALFPER